MANIFVVRFAETLLNYSLSVREGDIFLVRTSPLATELLTEIYRLALQAGAFVSHELSFDGQSALYYGHAQPEHLDWVAPWELLQAQTVTTRLTINAPYNTREAAGADAAKLSRRARALGELGRITRQRAAAGDLRWCSTLFPTHALAQEAGLSLREYEDFVYHAMFLTQEDPIAAWRAFSVQQQAIANRLEQVRTLRIVARDTDLELSVAGRRWINSDGRRNFPSGEVFTSPVEDTARGHIRFSYPAVANGRDVEDVHLWFEKGRVVRAEAGRGEEYLRAMLDTDPGARYLGEVAVGNNYNITRFTRNTLFDEKIGGTCHLALGASYPDTGGLNDSAIHWDMVCDLRQGGAIYADGELIHKDGRWLVP
ncbi:MAG: aminopeptidase [Chthonomonadales bacterium]